MGQILDAQVGLFTVKLAGAYFNLSPCHPPPPRNSEMSPRLVVSAPVHLIYGHIVTHLNLV